MDRVVEIEEALYRKCVDGVLPFGVQANVARDFGVSRTWVSAVAQRLGIPVAARPSKPPKQPRQRKYEDVERTCPVCGTVFVWTRRQQIEAARNIKRGAIANTEQYQPCCNPACAVKRGLFLSRVDKS